MMIMYKSLHGLNYAFPPETIFLDTVVRFANLVTTCVTLKQFYTQLCFLNFIGSQS